MTYCVGCDLGVGTTAWARSSSGPGSIDASGTLPSTVGLTGAGELRAAVPGGVPLTSEVSGFVSALGASEPIMVGATPYGPEALVAALIDAVVEVNVAATGVQPGALALVHDDGLDEFRLSLLREASRIAGVPAERLVLVTRGDATAADPAGGAAAGAAALGVAALPTDADDDGSSATITAAGAGAVGLAAGAAIGFGGLVTDGGVASAAGPAVGPAGTPLAGPGGAVTGPGGAPLTSAGPAGTPVGAAGPAGTPVGAAGPAGTPVGSAGPAGTPVASPGPAGTPVGPTTPVSPTPGGGGGSGAGALTPKPRPRWVPAAVVGGVAAVVVAAVAVVVLTGGEDSDTEALPVDTATVTTVTTVTEPVVSEPGVVPVTTLAPETSAAPEVSTVAEPDPGEFDTTAFIGEWEGICQPFIENDGASTQRFAFAPTGPNQLGLTITGVDYTTPDCSDAGTVIITQPASLTVVGETTVDGLAALQATSAIGDVVLAVDGDTLYFGEGSSFDPELTFTRR